MSADDLLSFAVRLAIAILGVIFAASATMKQRNRAQFRDAVQAYRLLPAPAAAFVARALIPIEFVLAVLLLSGLILPLALATTILLLAAFLMAGLIAVARGTDAPCGCFGDPGERLSSKTVARQLVLLALAVWAFGPTLARAAAGQADPSPVVAPSSHVLTVMSAALIVALAVWIERAGDVLVLIRHGRRAGQGVD